MLTLKSCVLDIETTELAAVGMGFITCAVVLPLVKDHSPIVFRYDEYHCPLGVEAKMVRALLNCLKEYDVLIGHNLKFDWGYLKSRALILGVPFPERVPLYYDTMEGFQRSRLRTRLNPKGKPKASLDHVWDFFYGKVGKNNPKTAIYPQEAGEEVWGRGVKRKEAIDHKVSHCIADTQMTWEVLDKVFPADPRRVLKQLT